jgi:hypothetical protein
MSNYSNQRDNILYRTPRGKRGGRLTRQNKENQMYSQLNVSTIPRSLMGASPFPPYMVRKLTYFEPGFVLQDPLNPFAIKEWRANDVFDPDPLLGGVSAVGFSELAAIYSLFRVEHVAFRFEVAANESAFAVSFGVSLRDTQPTTSVVSYATAQRFLEIAPTTGPCIVGQAAGQSVYRSAWHKIPISSIVGNPLLVNSDNGWVGTSTTSPAQLAWLAFVALSPGAALPLPNGVILHMYIEYTTRFFSIKQLL